MSGTRVSPADTVQCHTQDTPFLGQSYPSVRDTVSVLYASLTGRFLKDGQP